MLWAVWDHFQGGSLCFTSSLCWFFRITSSVALWGGEMLQTNSTVMHTVSQPCLTCPFSRRTNRSGSTMLSRESSGAGSRLYALPQSKLLRFGAQVALRGSDSAGTAFCAVPGPSSSGVWRARALRLVAFPVPAAQLSGCTAGAPCEADGDCPAPPEVLAKEPACS